MREFYGTSLKIYEKPSTFLLRKLEITKLLVKIVSYALLDIVLPPITTKIQSYLDVKQHLNLDGLFHIQMSFE